MISKFNLTEAQNAWRHFAVGAFCKEQLLVKNKFVTEKNGAYVCRHFIFGKHGYVTAVDR